ncbi:HupE/UreJ family protein [Patiriisocius sp. Uisw_017]|jgi:hydrogenase/urease accessory protein HupE|uniref:HupE/UreJ family protein n=1 Tax=Patiriisocius sp. Uisw_017 TaxID=3230968 RepID=UPI0039E8FF19
MDIFIFYFKQGLDHILDKDGLDHMLFIVAMVVFFEVKQWKRLLILVTAFTVGHSITLGLSSFELLKINRDLIEILIPVTIIITCINNLVKAKSDSQTSYYFLYALVLIFGCIHGLAFSNFLRMSLFEGENVLLPLVGFNLGIEVGQLLIVAIFLLVQQGVKKVLPGIKHKHIIISISIAISFVALWILFQLI